MRFRVFSERTSLNDSRNPSPGGVYHKNYCRNGTVRFFRVGKSPALFFLPRYVLVQVSRKEKVSFFFLAVTPKAGAAGFLLFRETRAVSLFVSVAYPFGAEFLFVLRENSDALFDTTRCSDAA